MRSIMVSVDYNDILAITLPYNRHHFSDMCIVTSTEDSLNVASIIHSVNQANPTLSPIVLYATDSFYANGADFNKWLALEQALDKWLGVGRNWDIDKDPWLCLMDADVLWPIDLKIEQGTHNFIHLGSTVICRGMLATPLRRMYSNVQCYADGEVWIPPERFWDNYPIHPNVNEWAGYSQIFHLADPVLSSTPWHEIDWRHAGGADSMFQERWNKQLKIRPSFEVLHIGEAGVNWCGRSTPYMNGTRNPQSGSRRRQTLDYIHARRHNKTDDKFRHEKLDILSQLDTTSTGE